MVTAGSAWLAGTGLTFARNPVFAAPTLATVSSYIPPVPTTITVSPATPPVVAGIEPAAYEAILYGKDIPLFVGGKMLIGGRICEGPFFGGTQADPTVSFIAYHAQNIIVEAITHTAITQARLRGQEVWNSTSGYIATDKVPSGSFAWNPGHQTNVAFSQSVGRYGANAVPYTDGITSSWQNIPLKPFGGIVPFPSVLVENSSYGVPADGIPRTQAISNVLRHMGLYNFEYQVDVSGSDPAWMVSSKMNLQEFLQQLRAIFTRYRITYSDKLRIIEPDTFAVNGELTNGNVLRDTLRFRRTDPMSLTRQKRYTYIDVDRDYEMNVAVAQEDRFPIPTTDGTASVSIELPIATTAAQAVADIHNSLYEELKVRSQMEGVLDRTLLGLECGDGVRFADSTVIDMTARVMETVHDFENWNVQFKAGEVIHCLVGPDPYMIYVVLLLGFGGDDGSTIITDESPAEHGVASVSGNAQIDTAQSKFGGSSLLTTKDGGQVDGISWATDADWDLSDSNSDTFTIECWAKTTDPSPLDSAIIANHGGGTPNLSWMVYVNTTGNGELEFLGTTSGGSYNWSPHPVTSGLTWDTGIWYHVAVDKDATGKVRIYRDGVMLASATPADSALSGGGGGVSVGANGPAGGRCWPGWIDEVRITKGICRYGSDAGYTVPTAAFSRI